MTGDAGVEGVSGEVCFRRQQAKGAAWNDPVKIALLRTDRAVALLDLFELSGNLERDAPAMTSATIYAFVARSGIHRFELLAPSPPLVTESAPGDRKKLNPRSHPPATAAPHAEGRREASGSGDPTSFEDAPVERGGSRRIDARVRIAFSAAAMTPMAALHVARRERALLVALESGCLEQRAAQLEEVRHRG
jgi:hypothetical protein